MAQIELHHYPCSLCGSTRRQVLFPANLPSDKSFDPAIFRQSYANLYTLRVVRCVDCGLIFNDPREASEDLSRIYSSVEDEEYLSELPGKLANFRRNLHTIERYASGGNLLDIGCGHGYFLSLADPKRWQCTGIEPAADAAQEARERYHLTVYNTDADEASIPPGSVNAIALLHVIEHVFDPMALLRRINELLAPGGIVYIETPNIGGKLARWTGRHWWYIMRFHSHYFSPATLQAACRKAGLEVLESFFPTKVWSLGYLISRLSVYLPLFSPLLKSFAKGLNLYRVLLTLTFGDQIAVVARKPASHV